VPRSLVYLLIVSTLLASVNPIFRLFYSLCFMVFWRLFAWIHVLGRKMGIA